MEGDDKERSDAAEGIEKYKSMALGRCEVQLLLGWRAGGCLRLGLNACHEVMAPLPALEAELAYLWKTPRW
ncbi:MAG: hypothetical protein ACP5E5_13545 [Acidobacteriaceae bacterium]